MYHACLILFTRVKHIKNHTRPGNLGKLKCLKGLNSFQCKNDLCRAHNDHNHFLIKSLLVYF